MSTVTVKTAAATQAILDQTLASVTIDGAGHLICTRHDGSTFDAGNARGIQGIPGPEGEVSTADLAAAILAAKNDTGLGILGRDAVGTEQVWGFDADGWNKITGLAVTFNQVAGRCYKVSWGILMSSGADLVTFDVEARDGSIKRGRDGGTALQNGRAASCGGSGEWTAVSTGSKTIELWGRADTANDVHVESGYLETWLTVSDIGVI